MANDSFHDVIGIGASAGGVRALSTLVGQLPRDLKAAVLIVQHSAGGTTLLRDILGRAGPLPTFLAEDNQALEQGRIYLGIRDKHLWVKDGRIRVTRGPKESHWRPSVDVLFRSLALEYRSRVVGVILSGSMYDGTAGLQTIKRCGGIAIVQDPTDSVFGEMPASALANVAVDHYLPLSEMGELLVRLTKELAADPPGIPEDLLIEKRFAEGQMNEVEIENLSSCSGLYGCPDCGGPLREIEVEGLSRYQCRVGHAYTAESLLDGQDEPLERALWGAIRTFEERITVLTNLAERSKTSGQTALVQQYQRRAVESRSHPGITKIPARRESLRLHAGVTE